jgi:hypothetical protein
VTFAPTTKAKTKRQRDIREEEFSKHSSGVNQQNFNTKKILPDWRAMKATDWKTYRTRFLVKAKQLSSDLNFTDSLGRHHSGRRGDYLVESSDGLLRIAPQQIFEDVYVPMALVAEEHIIGLDQVARVRPKLSQPCRERRASGDSARFN